MALVMQASDHLDLLKTTLPYHTRGIYTQLATKWTEFPLATQMMRKNRMKIRGGHSYTRRVMLKHGGQAAAVGWYDVDSYDGENKWGNITVPWRNTHVPYRYEAHVMAANSSDPEQLVDYIAGERDQALIDLAEFHEGILVGKAVDDGKTPFSLQYWLTYDSGTTGDFNGGNHPNFSGGKGGLDSDLAMNARWKNWAVKYENVSAADLLHKMKRGFIATQWRSPFGVPDYESRMNRQYLMNTETMIALENIGEAQNESLGRDIYSMYGNVTFRGIPFVHVPALDEYSTSNPIYGVDWGCMEFIYLKGFWWKETGPRISAGQRHVYTVDIDFTWNLVCNNLRKQQLFAQADPNDE